MPWKKILLEGDAAVLSDTAPVDVDFNAASAGTATTASRQDHKHSVPVAVAGDLVAVDGGAASAGSLNKFVRADHKHPLGPLVAALDFSRNKALKLVLDVVSSHDTTPVTGQIDFLSTDNHPYVYVP
jgi:hypothetical protein